MKNGLTAVLLCAGFATRLYPLTRDRPKPLLEVGGVPIVEDLVLQLAATGRIGGFVLVSNARFYGRFVRWAQSLAPRLGGVPLQVLDDGARDNATRLGAISDLEFAAARARITGPALAVAGDNLFRFPLGALLDDYTASPRNLVLVERETDLERLRRTGVAEIDVRGRLLALHEKPADPPTNLAVPPLYLFRPGALDLLRRYVSESHQTDAPGHFIAWLARHEPVFVRELPGARLDVGDLESYRGAEAWLRRMRRELPC